MISIFSKISNFNIVDSWNHDKLSNSSISQKNPFSKLGKWPRSHQISTTMGALPQVFHPYDLVTLAEHRTLYRSGSSSFSICNNDHQSHGLLHTNPLSPTEVLNLFSQKGSTKCTALLNLIFIRCLERPLYCHFLIGDKTIL